MLSVLPVAFRLAIAKIDACAYNCTHSLSNTTVFCAWLQQKRKAEAERKSEKTAQRSLKELEQVLSESCELKKNRDVSLLKLA